MGVLQTLNFDNAANFTLTDAEIVGSFAQLGKIPNTGQTFSQAFSAPTGFTYDNTKAEFVGGVLRQKDLRPVDAILAATYTLSKDLSWSAAGSLTATDIGTPTLAAGKLACLGGGNNAVRYESADIGSSGNVGAIKLKYTPNYSGTPVSNYNIFEFAPVSGNNDRMLVIHSASGGTLRLTAYTSVGTVKHSAVILGAAWSPVAGTEYEIELNWDTVAGQLRLFVNGVLQGAAPVSSYSRGTDADRLYIGAGTVYSATDASFNDVVVFSTVQHTSGYTPTYTLPEYIYAGSKVDGPNFTYTGIGGVLSVDDGSTVETGAPRYIVGLQYWNGSAWVVSNGTYSQANDFATALANFTSFVTGGGGTLPWSVVFDNSNSLSSIDSFMIEVTGQKYSPTGFIEPTQGIQVQEILSVSQVSVDTASAFIQMQIRVDGVLKYWNGIAWVNSDGTFAQSNTVAVANTNISSLVLTQNSEVFARWCMVTSANTETPTITSAEIDYDFGSVATDPSTCIVYGYYLDISGQPVSGATVTFSLYRNADAYSEANNNIIEKGVSTTTDVNGYFETVLIRSSEYENGGTYQITIVKDSDSLSTTKKKSGQAIKFTVPDTTTSDITDRITA